MVVGETPLNGNIRLRRYSLNFHGDMEKFLRELQSVANSVKILRRKRQIDHHQPTLDA